MIYQRLLYDLVIKNVRNSKAFAPITITRENYDIIKDYIIDISSLGFFRGILFNTLPHTPLMLRKYGFSQAERAVILDRIWKLKEKGYPVIMSKQLTLLLGITTGKDQSRKLKYLSGINYINAAEILGTRKSASIVAT